jgi:hypothetical protein
MKLNMIILLSFLTVFIPACGNNTIAKPGTETTVAAQVQKPITDTLKRGVVINHVACINDATQSYAIYIPAKETNETLPVVYFFDPHADGSLPVNKYKGLADEFGFILAGSNNSKNGNDWATTEKIWQVLSADVTSRVKLNNNRIYACGFSGGAKAAGQIALAHSEVKAVIANGAGMPDGTEPGNFSFSFTGITGEGDMNMTDLVSYTAALDKSTTHHRILFFDGKHEWAPAATMKIAFTGLQLDAMRNNLIPTNEAFLDTYISNSKKKIADLTAANNWIKAEREARLSSQLLDGLTNEISWFAAKEKTIEASTVFQKQWDAQQKLLVTEQNQKRIFQQQFQQGDIDYWKKTIADLNQKAKPATAEGAMNQRLLAYLSLAFYSITNRCIVGNNNDEGRYFDELYKMADPTNSEAWYFSAILNARVNNVTAVTMDLDKSLRLGFNDKNRMLQQPEFVMIADKINLLGIADKIK